jgi:hypothetical protein
MLRGAPRFLTRQRSRSWGRVRSQWNGRSRHTQRQGDLGTLRGEQLGLEGKGVDCMSKFTAVHEACAACLVRSLSSAQLIHAGQRPPCVRRAGAMHALTHDNAVSACGVLRAVRGVPLQQAAQLAHPNCAGASVLLPHGKRAICRR